MNEDIFQGYKGKALEVLKNTMYKFGTMPI